MFGILDFDLISMSFVLDKSDSLRPRITSKFVFFDFNIYIKSFMFYDSATGDQYSSFYAPHPIFDERPIPYIRKENMTASRANAQMPADQLMVDLNFIILTLLIFFITLLGVSVYYNRAITRLEKRIDKLIAGRVVGNFEPDEDY